MSAPLPSSVTLVTMVEVATALGISKQAVARRADKESWPFEETSGRGGKKRIYPIACLPKDVRESVDRLRKAKDAVANPSIEQRMMKAFTVTLDQLAAEKEQANRDRQARAEAFLQASVGLSDFETLSLKAHCEIAEGWKVFFLKRQPMKRSHSWEPYAESYRLGEIPVSKAVREAYPEFSGRSVQRWVTEYERGNFAALVDHRNGSDKKGKSIFSATPLLAAYAKKLMLERPGIKTESLYELLKTASIDAESGEVLFQAPSYHQVYRFQRSWIAENSELYLQQTNPDAWKNSAMVAYGNASEDVTEYNQRWEMDATPADWLLIDPDGKKRRYTVSGVINVYSRQAIVVVAPTPKTQTHCFALRLALLAWGVPKRIVTDNGADYQSDHFKRVLDALGVDHRTTKPFSGEEKPHIERFIGTLNHSILELLPNFAGHNVAERKAIEARRSFAERLARKGEIVDFADVVDGSCTGEFLQERINEWLLGIYSQREHSGLGTSPFLRAASWTGDIRRIRDERALDTLLARPASQNGQRTVQKKGILLDGAWFIAPALARIQTGHLVDVFETEDLGRIIVHYEGEFVCVAECPERTGANRADIAALADTEQKERLKEARRRIKQETRGAPDTDELLSRHLREKAAAAGKLVQATFGGTSYTSHGLEQAALANQAIDGIAKPSAGALVIGGKVMTNLPQTAPKAEVHQMPSQSSRSQRTPEENMAEWQEIDRRIVAGETVSEADARWHRTYPTSAQYRAESKKKAAA